MDVDEIVVFSILNNKNITGEFIEDYKLLQSENERLRKKLHDILLVDTTDGMTASEWVDRTAKAESQLAQLRAATTDANVGFMIQNKALKKANDINAQLHHALKIIAKAKGDPDKIVCLATIKYCADIAKDAIEATKEGG